MSSLYTIPIWPSETIPRRRLTSKLPCDPDYRRLRYLRYADDFLLGFIGPKHEAEEIRDRLGEFLRGQLGLALSPEKTLITHASDDKAKFLGYEITVVRCETLISENGSRATNVWASRNLVENLYTKEEGVDLARNPPKLSEK